MEPTAPRRPTAPSTEAGPTTWSTPLERPATPEHDVIVLAGGGGTRLGGVDKSTLEIGGRTLLDRVLEVAAAAAHVVVVGSVAVPDHVLQTVEDPPSGGPVAGIAAGVTMLARSANPAPWTLVIAVDQPEAAHASVDLLAAAAAAGPDVDMVCPHDETGHPQWLLAAYRTRSLTSALQPFGTGHSVAVRRLVSGLRAVGVHTRHTGDIDTWQDHTAWQARVTTPHAARTTRFQAAEARTTHVAPATTTPADASHQQTPHQPTRRTSDHPPPDAI